MADPIEFGDLAHTILMLGRLADWFDAFGNYTRADDCRRLADGLHLYSEDILSRKPAGRGKPPKTKPSSQRPWGRGYGQ